jgi:hypothetical protein
MGKPGGFDFGEFAAGFTNELNHLVDKGVGILNKPFDTVDNLANKTSSTIDDAVKTLPILLLEVGGIAVVGLIAFSVLTKK